MPSTIVMPKMGYDMTTGKILRWLKAEGDPLKQGEAVAEIQTDKVNIEIEAFESGVLAKILHQPGEDVAVGQAIGLVTQPGETLEPTEIPITPSHTTGPMAPTSPLPPGPAAAPTLSPVSPPRSGSAPEGGPAALSGARAPGVQPGARLKASPLARRIAHERGLDLHSLVGSGPGGRIVKRDVESQAPSRPAISPSEAREAPVPGDREVPLSRMRQAIARRLTQSKVAAPHFYVTVVIDMTEAIALRERLNRGLAEPDRVSYNDLLIRAIALACQRFPEVNASWGDSTLTLHAAIHVGLAVALDEGLVVPVIRDVQAMRLVELARQTKDVIARARANRSRPEETSGGTITLSSLGSYGVESFTAIINPPESAILAVGAIAREPVVGKDDQVTVRSRMRVTMSSDHRVIDGALAARYLAEFRRVLEDPLTLLL